MHGAVDRRKGWNPSDFCALVLVTSEYLGTGRRPTRAQSESADGQSHDQLWSNYAINLRQKKARSEKTVQH